MASKFNDKGIWELVDTHLLPLSVLENNKGQVKGIPENPRFLKDESFSKLKKSLTDDPEFLSLNPLSVYELNGKYVVMCGNMRLHAARELGFKVIPCQIIPKEWDRDKILAYIIKDNVAFGEWDHDLLANEWNEFELLEWGVPVWDTEALFDEGTSFGEKETGVDECVKIIIDIPCQLKEQATTIEDKVRHSLQSFDGVTISLK